MKANQSPKTATILKMWIGLFIGRQHRLSHDRIKTHNMDLREMLKNQESLFPQQYISTVETERTEKQLRI